MEYPIPLVTEWDWPVAASVHRLHRTPSALKHFLDSAYYPVMDDTEGRPYAVVAASLTM